jgi:hypothetical protein
LRNIIDVSKEYVLHIEDDVQPVETERRN